MDEFKEKSLKLLADPLKLKKPQHDFYKVDRLKQELEFKFNHEINPILYQHLLKQIEKEIIISSILNTIINQVNVYHNP